MRPNYGTCSPGDTVMKGKGMVVACWTDEEGAPCMLVLAGRRLLSLRWEVLSYMWCWTTDDPASLRLPYGLERKMVHL